MSNNQRNMKPIDIFRPMTNTSGKYHLNDSEEPQKIKKIKVDEHSAQDQDNKSNQNNNVTFVREYDSRNIRYCTQDYSYLSNLLLIRFSQNYNQEIATNYPLFRILRGITKKFMLNELEIIFFLHIIQETKWNYDDQLINSFVNNFTTDFLPMQEVLQKLKLKLKIYKADEYKKLLLYLISCAYAIKCYLNETHEIHFINAHINQFIKIEEYSKFMDQWRTKFMQGSIKIMPRAINKLFVNLKLPHKDFSQQQVQVDYNQLVDSIIQISPSYSSNEKQHLTKVEGNGLYQAQSLVQQQSIPNLIQQHSYNLNQSSIFNLNSNAFRDRNQSQIFTSILGGEDQYIHEEQHQFLQSSFQQQPNRHASPGKVKKQQSQQKKAEEKEGSKNIKEEEEPAAPASLLRGPSTYIQHDAQQQG